MSQSLKALCWSVFVYPGSGHLFLKKYVSGTLFMGAFSIPLFLLVADLMDKVNQIVAGIENGEIPLDSIAITNAITNLTASAAGNMDFNMISMLVIWCVAAIDAYRIGRKK